MKASDRETGRAAEVATCCEGAKLGKGARSPCCSRAQSGSRRRGLADRANREGRASASGGLIEGYRPTAIRRELAGCRRGGARPAPSAAPTDGPGICAEPRSAVVPTARGQHRVGRSWVHEALALALTLDNTVAAEWPVRGHRARGCARGLAAIAPARQRPHLRWRRRRRRQGRDRREGRADRTGARVDPGHAAVTAPQAERTPEILDDAYGATAHQSGAEDDEPKRYVDRFAADTTSPSGSVSAAPADISRWRWPRRADRTQAGHITRRGSRRVSGWISRATSGQGRPTADALEALYDMIDPDR